MRTAADLVKSKHHQTVFTVGPDASVLEAVRLLAEHDIGALVVVEQGRVVGVVSERDCARKVIPASRPPADTPVRDIMTANVRVIRPELTSGDCMTLMTESRLRHLPVMDGSRLLGLVSIGDLVKDIISDQTFTIQQLEHYITGERG
jgi:CBS domain-containing protein